MNPDIDFFDGCSSGGHRVALFHSVTVSDGNPIFPPPSRWRCRYSHDNILAGIDPFRIVVTMSELGESWRLASLSLPWHLKSLGKVVP